MADTMPASMEKGLRNLMKGNGHDKLEAENRLKKHDPDYFSEDILDIWLKGSVKSQERSKRVLEAWGKTEE